LEKETRGEGGEARDYESYLGKAEAEKITLS